MFFLAAHNKQHHNRVRRRLRQVWEILHTGQIIAVATAFELTTNQCGDMDYDELSVPVLIHFKDVCCRRSDQPFEVGRGESGKKRLDVRSRANEGTSGVSRTYVPRVSVMSTNSSRSARAEIKQWLRRLIDFLAAT